MRISALRDPFSIRETGVYHKFQMDPVKCTWILLNPPDNLSKRLNREFSEPGATGTLGQLRCHALILLCLSENWREYVNHLEEKFSELVCGTRLSMLHQS